MLPGQKSGQAYLDDAQGMTPPDEVGVPVEAQTDAGPEPTETVG